MRMSAADAAHKITEGISGVEKVVPVDDFKVYK